jgi:hypothetical protein
VRASLTGHHLNTEEIEMITNTICKRRDVRIGAGLALLTLATIGLGASGCGGDGGGPPANCAAGQIQTSWVLDEGGQQVECLSGDEVDLRVDTDAMTVTFDCSAHGGTTDAVEGGVSHDVSLKLFDANNNLLSSTSHMSLFVPCGVVQPTPQVDFSL